MTRYRCPECDLVAEVDLDKRTIKIEIKGDVQNPSSMFPLHPFCELAKSLDEIDFCKLEKI